MLKADSAETKALLQRFELGDLWGVGRRLVERLAVIGIRTGWDLAQADPSASADSSASRSSALPWSCVASAELR
ncbi:hypothetical protein [Billgrantia desiderata]|uniref:hypothetical protein n=1 Tax=Billgrantia desiderata TaxID=52021 RepID=UPI001F32A227